MVAIGLTYVQRGGFNAWALANDIVVIYPQLGQQKYHGYTPANAILGDCWDSYGLTGDDYATRYGVQMDTVRRMLKKLGFQ